MALRIYNHYVFVKPIFNHSKILTSFIVLSFARKVFSPR